MNLVPAAVAQRLHDAYRSLECRERRLLYLFLEITRRCNLACRHCGSDCASQPAAVELTTESWCALIDDVGRRFSPPPTLVLTGGEPLLHPDFERITGHIHAQGMRWGMVTNGYALDADAAAILSRNGAYSVTVSVDGTQPVHDRLRGRVGSYDRAVTALDRLAAAAIEIVDVVTCVHPGNLDELDTVARLLLAHRVGSWRLFRIFPAGRALRNSDLLLSAAQTRRMLDWVARQRTPLRRRGLTLNYACEGWLPMEIDRTIRDQPFFCRAGINIASILCDGRITGCTNNHDRFVEGNVVADSFARVWRDGFKPFRDRSWVSTTSCGACPQLRHCKGGSMHLWRDDGNRPAFCYLECFDGRPDTGAIAG